MVIFLELIVRRNWRVGWPSILVWLGPRGFLGSGTSIPKPGQSWTSQDGWVTRHFCTCYLLKCSDDCNPLNVSWYKIKGGKEEGLSRWPLGLSWWVCIDCILKALTGDFRRGCHESHRDQWIQGRFLHKGTEYQKNQNQKGAGSGFCYFMKPEPMWPRIGKHVWADFKTCVRFLSN